MQRNVIQDVVPPGRRSIRNITLNKEKARKEVSFPPEPLDTPPPPPNRTRGRFFGWLFALLSLAAVGGFVFFLLTAFASAQVDVSPKSENVELNLRFNISQKPVNNDLRYEVIDVTKQAAIEVKASGEEMAELKSSGKITIYNDFGPEEQRLIARTRFQTAQGLVFRIAESVVVPGAKVVDGKSVPGTIDAAVFADEPGEKYNVGPSEFTIPGFKDDAKRFSSIYAKSSAPMSGGLIGKVNKVSEADKTVAQDAMKTSLRADLEKEIFSKLPENLVALKGAVIYQYRELPPESQGDKAILKQEGTAKIIVLEKSALAQLVAQEYLKNWDSIKVNIDSFDDLTLSSDKSLDLNQNIIAVNLTGKAPVSAVVEQDKIAASLAGKPKADLKVIMADFPGVVSAKVSLKPVWKSSFPEDSSKIHVNIEPGS
jgi:hypothetical protein